MLNCNSPDLATTTHFVPHVLIETKNLHDRQFASDWLLKIVETRWVWKELLEDPALEESSRSMGEPCVGNLGEFLVSSIWRPYDNGASFKSSVAVFDFEIAPSHFWPEFAILVQLGFFVLCDEFYHPSIPKSVTNKAVQQAAEKVASTAIGDPHNMERLLHVLAEDEVDRLLSSNRKGVGGRR